MNKYLDLLGLKAKDKVTGFEGVVSSVCFDLYGCVQMVLTPEVKEGKFNDSHWFDEKRLEILDHNPVMATPSFESIPGPQEKPYRSTKA